ncbi:NADH-quinone oxidoreductase subunit C [Cytobacillus sp. FSL W7-1323]|uniref:NADH-quinone oxidoreductase subunit C n=1 Tax=Cytobacillus sp. FSL W7-1323 TaxID=2921700 RepID=UPI0031596097
MDEKDKERLKKEAAEKARAAAQRKREEREKKKEESHDSVSEVNQTKDDVTSNQDLEKQKAAAAAKAKAAAIAKKKAKETEGKETEPTSNQDLEKQKAAAAAKAKAAAIAKKKAKETKGKETEPTSNQDLEKQKAIAIAKAKAAAAAKRKAKNANESGDSEKAKAIAAAKAKAAAAAKARGKTTQAKETEEPEPITPSPQQPILDRYLNIVKEHYKEDILEDSYINRMSKHVPTIVVKLEHYYSLALLFKQHSGLHFEFLSELHGTDFETYMEIYVHLYSFKNKQSVALKVKMDRENPRVDSIATIWPGANWPECEAYDLLGIQFTNHPDLHRIMLGEDWVGHPLRKDYEPYDVEV